MLKMLDEINYYYYYYGALCEYTFRVDQGSKCCVKSERKLLLAMNFCAKVKPFVEKREHKAIYNQSKEN